MTICLLRILGANLFARLGLPRAQYQLAFSYYVGKCVKRDPVQAVRWSEKAAARGHTRAQLLLSDLKVAGFGTVKDYVGAFSLAEQAARGKDPRALHSLAWFYQQGLGTKADQERAFSLWREAAELGNPASQYAVAYCLFNGAGTSREIAIARGWCELALRNGFQEPPAQELLKKIRSELGDRSAPDSASRSQGVVEDVDQRLGTRGDLRTRSMAWLELSFTALRHAMFGLDEHAYHLRQSRGYERLGDHEKVIAHSRKLLAIGEHPETRARLAYAYLLLRRNAEAVREFRKAAIQWNHPAIVLGLAQAELRSGNVETARQLLEQVQRSHLNDYLRYAIAELQAELESVREV
jgi:hypothetical protein